jgi:serine/threonine-protein kinase
MSAFPLSITLAESPHATRGRVLCVDDELNILRALSWLLRKEFQVVTAQSAYEGLELIKTGDFDVVISDQRMPEMSGVEFLSEVKVLAPRAMRILLTGYSDMDAVLRSVNESEIFRFVNKPWNVIELPSIVAQAAEIAKNQKIITLNSQPSINVETPNGLVEKILVIDDDEVTHSTVEMSAGDLAEVIHVTNPSDAFKVLQEKNIGVILAERKLGTMDLTHFLCLLKRQHPQIVSIVLTETPDSNLICQLINQGQIFRFIQKPVKPGFLRLTLKSALVKRAELIATPSLISRHQVEVPSSWDTNTLSDQKAGNVNTLSDAITDPVKNLSLFAKVGGFMRRAFGN